MMKKALTGSCLTEVEMGVLMEGIFSQAYDSATVLAFLKKSSERLPTYGEVVGAVRYLRKKSIPLKIQSEQALDNCGTGGDGKQTFNISTTAALVISACGITVAKHGNRSVSSKSGSADVLEALGVNTSASLAQVATCVDKIGIGFLFAPNYHPVMKLVAPVRAQWGKKTIFNVLGPLLNPARVSTQVIGVYDAGLLEIVARAGHELGIKKLCVVHGDDGLDEVTLTSSTSLCTLEKGVPVPSKFDPLDVGYAHCSADSLVGGSAQDNAKRLRQTLKGHSEPIDHVVHLNAALAVKTHGLAENFPEALLIVQEAISSGRAFQKLEALIELSHSAEINPNSAP